MADEFIARSLLRNLAQESLGATPTVSIELALSWERPYPLLLVTHRCPFSPQIPDLPRTEYSLGFPLPQRIISLFAPRDRMLFLLSYSSIPTGLFARDQHRLSGPPRIKRSPACRRCAKIVARVAPVRRCTLSYQILGGKLYDLFFEAPVFTPMNSPRRE